MPVDYTTLFPRGSDFPLLYGKQKKHYYYTELTSFLLQSKDVLPFRQMALAYLRQRPLDELYITRRCLYTLILALFGKKMLTIPKFCRYFRVTYWTAGQTELLDIWCQNEGFYDLKHTRLEL